MEEALGQGRLSGLMMYTRCACDAFVGAGEKGGNGEVLDSMATPAFCTTYRKIQMPPFLQQGIL